MPDSATKPLAESALDALVRLLGSDDPDVVLRAARMILEYLNT